MEWNEGENEAEDDGSILIDGVRVPAAPLPVCSNTSSSDLFIREMICENFKSYAGLRRLGPFHQGFNSVIGPNGSGKSNVIDAMLFVFGYRANKIRSKNISVLIHNSSEHPNAVSCSVTVVFVNPQTEEELRVRRTAFKDNSSFYEVDGKRKQFKVIAKLLRAKGIDLDHNRFLILQGEVEQIALMKPKALGDNDSGMLEFLEDIIGSSRLKEPIEIFKERVSTLDEARTEKLNRVKLVEKEKDDLEGPKNEALRYLKLENELIEMKNKKLQAEARRCEIKLESVKEKKSEFEESSKEVLEKIKTAQEERIKAETELKNIEKEAEKMNNELEETKEKFKNHELEDSKLMEEMKLTNAKRKKIVAQSKAEKEKYEKLLLVPEENRKKIEECVILRDKNSNLVKEEQAKYDEAIKSIKAETQEYQDKKETYETKLIDLKKVVNDTDSKVAVAKSQLEIEESKEKKERGKLEQYQTSLENAKSSLEEKTREIKSAQKSLPETKKQLEELKKEIDTISVKVEKYQEQLKASRVSYEETKSSYQATKSRGKVHGALMEQKSNGKIPGIFGRLGDLGAIDKKFDVAVSTAGGGSLDTIIVDTVDTGKACINFLRKHDVGRANFLALDKTDCWKPYCEKDFRAPENVNRLFDLIRVAEPKFKPAFYHYLRDTLVANEMAQAQRIAFGRERFRVVTVDGEIIEKSGAMSGGGREKARGKMGSQVSATTSNVNLADLEKSLSAKEETLRAASSTKAELEKTQFDFEKKCSMLEESSRKHKLEKERLEQDIKILETKVSDQSITVKENRTDKKKLAELSEELESVEKENSKAAENAKEVEDVVNKLNKQIKDIMGSKVKTIQKKLDDAKSQLDKMKKEITRLEVGIKSSDRDIEKSKDKYSNYDAEVTEAENKMRTMKSQREELERIGKNLFENLAKFKELRKQKGEEYETRRSAFEKIKENEKKYKSSQIEIDEKLSFYDASIKEETRNIAHFKKECKKLSLRQIPGEDSKELDEYGIDTLEAVDLKNLQYQKTILEENIAKLKPNLAVIEEFKQKESVYLERISELNKLTSKRDAQKKNYEDLRKMRLNEFMEGFAIITSKLKEMYQMITLGGDAELELVDSLDPFAEGIVFSVRPPKKSWKNISNLSGGEKTLSSLALVFALHYYKPTPLYVMDEIDAALDFKNVSIIANYIKERTKNVQFIIISLRSNMFELAERLVGIYKTCNASKSITLDPAVVASNRKSNCATNLTNSLTS